MPTRLSFFFFSMTILLLLTLNGCSSHKYISGTDTYEGSDCIRVLDVEKDEALAIGFTAAQETFGNVRISISNKLIAKTYSNSLGGARSVITPVKISSQKQEHVSGFVFDVLTEGDGINQTLVPAYITSIFAKHVQEYINQDEIPTKVICNFEVSKHSEKSVRSTGTCWLVDSKGYLVTCEHVVGKRRTLQVVLADGTTQDATVVLTDKTNDLAILKIAPLPEKYHPIPVMLGKYSKVGEEVSVLGFPKGERVGNSLKMTSGSISSLLGFRNNITEYQLDATINGGNSGGPVFNSHGSAIGIVSSKLVSKQTEGIGYIKKTNCLALLFAQVGITPAPTVKEIFSPQEIYEQYKNSVFLIRQY